MANKDEANLQISGDVELLTAAISRFALQLYKEQGKRNNGNIFMSPFSISAVLNMAYLGARGQTMAEMKSTLSLSDLDDDKIHQAFGDLINYLKSCNDKVADIRTKKVEDGKASWEIVKEPIFKLFMANRLYGEKSYNFLQDFQANCQKFYAAEICPVDFVQNARDAEEQINSWVLDCTNQKIKDILSPGTLDRLTRLVLVNAIYFKSAWSDPFKKENTQEADFFVSSEETIKVQMMHQNIDSGTYGKLDDLHCQVVKLPYMRLAASMIIFVPDKATSLESFEKNLTADHLTGIDSSLRSSYNVNIWLPKFKLEESVDLKEVLEDMGMKSIFEEGCADLSGIDGTRKLFASKVAHKAFVDVNEEGTEAAAATAMKMMLMCLRPTVDFRADRPFLFLIREETTKAVLFLGRLIRPRY